MKSRNMWMILWAVIYILNFKINCFGLMANKGIKIIEAQYYRFFTGLLVHVNLFHLLINMVALYFAYKLMNDQISKVILWMFPLFIGILTNIIFSIIYSNCQSVGGSPIVFSLIGLIFALQLFGKDNYEFQWNSTCGYWIIGFAVFGNIPVFSRNISTLVIHTIAFIFAFIIGMIGVYLRIF